MTSDIENAASTRELLNAFRATDWRAGSAEPWVANLLQALLIANNTRTAVEIGGFEGFTSKRLAQALVKLPHATTLTVCEIDAARAQLVDDAIDAAVPTRPRFSWTVVCDDSHRWIPTLAEGSIDFVWLDGNHEKPHVAREIELLLPKLSDGGLLCGHDTHGVCDLQAVFKHFGGYALDLPRLGPAGGVGLIQR